MTPLQQPELLPGLPVNHRLRFSAALTDAFSELTSAFAGSNRNAIPKSTGSNLKDRLIALLICIFVPLIFLPAWAYRFILKSTLWFWWILLIVGGAPRLDGGIEGLRADAYRKAWAWVGIATTLFAVVGFGFGWLLKPWVDNLAAEAKLPTAVALLVLVNWKSILIIQLITLASASTTLGVLFLTQAVYVDSQNPRRAELVAARLPWLGELVKWKTLFGAVGIALLMLYFALYANAVHHFVLVSDWAAGWLRWLYGDVAERLRPGHRLILLPPRASGPPGRRGLPPATCLPLPFLQPLVSNIARTRSSATHPLAANKTLAKPGIVRILSACRNASPFRAERRRRQESMKQRAEPLKFFADNLGGRVAENFYLNRS
jgi:hypothetical protein